MKTTGLRATMLLLAALLILGGEAFAGWGGGNRRGRGGPGPALAPGTPAEPQEQAPPMGRGPGAGAPDPQFRRPGPGRGDGPWTNVPPARGPRGGNYTVCPYCGAPCPGGGWGIGLGRGRGPMSRFENRYGRPGPGFQGGAWGPAGWGFRRGAGIRQPAPPAENWRRGPWQGRGGEGLAPQDRTPEDRGPVPRWRQGGAGGRSGPEALTPPAPPLEEEENDFWAPPRWQRWGPGRGPGLYPWDEFDIDIPGGPEVTAPPEKPTDRPAKTPEASVPAAESPQP